MPSTNDLLTLPECPIKSCPKCGATPDAAGWIDIRVGCGACTPDLERLSLELAGKDGRIFLLEEALRQVQGAERLVGAERTAKILRALKIELPPSEIRGGEKEGT
jgi:hypothetical protein